MNLTPASELVDEVWGKPGTPERDEMEVRLRWLFGETSPLDGMDGDVKAMFDIVVKGRTAPCEYPSLNAKVYHLKTMKEMRESFSAVMPL